MQDIQNKSASDNTVVPIRGYDERAAMIAYRRYSALRQAERTDPGLANEPWFAEQRDAAYATFFHAFAALI